MRIFSLVLLVLIALLSIAAGAAKVMQIPQELDFLNSVGLSTVHILVFGAIQILGGLLLFIPKTKVFGAILVTLAFMLSTVLIVIAGDMKFALISIIPVALCIFVLSQARAADK